MLKNDGIIHTKFPVSQNSDDSELVYNGKYIDLLSYKEKHLSHGNDGTHVVMIDTETGLPAAASLSQIDKNGEQIVRVNTVTFDHQGQPAALSFINDVADKFCYLDQISSTDRVWETDSDTLKVMLADYSAQALEADVG